MTTKPHIVVVERHAEGHHPTYLAAILSALADGGRRRVSTLLTPAAMEHPRVAASLTENGVLVRPLPPTPRRKKKGHPWLTWRYFNLKVFRMYAEGVRVLEQQAGPASMAFVPCLYDVEMLGFGYTRFLFPWRTGGLYMNSAPFRDALSGVPSKAKTGPTFLQDPRLACVGLLDEGIVPEVQAFAPRTVAGAVPDFAAIEPPVEPTGWPRIEAAARGKPIVGLFGYLKRSKGLLTFMQAAQRLNARACFVAAGELPLGEYSADEIHAIRAADAHPESGFALVEGRVESDGEFQELMRRATIISCAYEGFLNSSNQVSLATLLGRPVVAPPTGCIADRVRKHGLGVVAESHGVAALTSAISQALDHPSTPPDPASATDAFSLKRFVGELSSLVERAITPQQRRRAA
ncbi:MAG: glycosyltransferase [Planctomycetota bacterium]